jgi:glycosyltransferase involved in cell wall biosynthesis
MSAAAGAPIPVLETGADPAAPEAPRAASADGPLPAPTGRRLTFVTEKLAERSGGAERVLIETANALARRGHQVEILSHELRDEPPFYPLAPGVLHTNIRPQRTVRSRPRVYLDKARSVVHRRGALTPPLDRLSWASRHGGFANRLRRHLEVTAPHAVTAFMPPAIAALARAAPRGGPAPLRVASMHNAPEQDFENPERWDPAPYDRRRRRELMSAMDRILVLLPEHRDWYDAALRPRIRVMPNAVAPVAEAARQGPRERVILSVGRLAEVKRHALLLRAFARVADGFPGWQLRIYGHGPLADDLAGLIRDLGLGGRAHLMGHSTEVPQAYLASAFLAHAAKYEGFPLAVTEALASGLPVLGFADCAGLNRLVADGETGLLLDPGEAERATDDAPAPVGGPREAALAAGLARLMGDDALRTRLGRAGPASMAPYAPERVVDMWEEVLLGGG